MLSVVMLSVVMLIVINGKKGLSDGPVLEMAMKIRDWIKEVIF